MSVRAKCVAMAAVMLGLVAGGAGRANAGILFDNLTATTHYSGQIYQTASSASFSTGATADELMEVDLILSLNNPSTGATLTVSLYSAGIDYQLEPAPGTLLTTIGTLSDTLLSTSPEPYAFVLAAPYSLSADTRYWIALSDSANTAGWGISSDVSGPGVATEYDNVGGGSYANNPVNGAFQMEVIASSVPEPNAFGLLLAGSASSLLVLGLRRKTADEARQ